jgi:tRNA (pseudouridine54-N1)-methyltransferase
MPESTMLRFIQLLPQASPKADFLLKDLPGSGKRIDVLCRVLAACFEWGPTSWPKSKLEVIAVIGNTKSLTFRDPIDQIPEGEVGWASVIRESLRENPPSYIAVSDDSLEDIVKRLQQLEKSSLWVLEEEGVSLSDINTIDVNTQNSFMLGDHRGFDSEAESIISRYDIQRISLGKKSYLSSHCLTAIISEFERKAS